MGFELSAVTTAITLINHLFTIDIESYKSVGRAHAKWFAYEGFNALEILNSIIAVLKTNTSDDDAFEELIDLVLIGLTRGNIRVDQLDKTSRRGKDRIEELAKKYNIKMRKNNKDKVVLGGNTITFTRIVSVLPYIASQLINGKVITLEPTGCEFGSDSLPAAMRHPGFACLIPGKGYWARIIINAYLAYMISFGTKINPNDKSSIKEKYEKQRQFTNAAWSSKALYTNELRILTFQKLGLNIANYGPIYLNVANALMKSLSKEEFNGEKAMLLIKENLITYDELQ